MILCVCTYLYVMLYEVSLGWQMTVQMLPQYGYLSPLLLLPVHTTSSIIHFRFWWTYNTYGCTAMYVRSFFIATYRYKMDAKSLKSSIQNDYRIFNLILPITQVHHGLKSVDKFSLLLTFIDTIPSHLRHTITSKNTSSKVSNYIQTTLT